ncbi:MAG TPA: acyl-CoA dehydrogenase [Balneola sp.]|jgi:alkylation response protein AidB-like acyl-CoA dehydrogenase|nr:acyl-CoA dehydrogenase [Balneola sp.]MAO77257.1 acyl-CoA dehydrogenase [Balneola sp.]MBF63029.1 acyl-CoA dehydrogenase [Balneola sp.]HAH52087.1 acyl-CoA dehydrogenase [Balneola sp.]|tara:strand:+ start:57442 stop:58605 length:1164 start_codon:yes stop_codon:yes gene_type:complete
MEETELLVPPLTTLTEDEQLLKDAAADFAQASIKPLVEEMDENAKLDSGLIKEFFEMGLMGIDIPEKYNGGGGTFMMSVVAIEQISRVDGSAGVFMDVQNTLVNNAFVNYASDFLKEKYLPQLATEKVGAYCLSEAGSGSDAFALKCKAKEDGDSYILNGAKLWITNANEADIFIVLANANPEAGYKGITAFVVERGFEGFSVSKKENKLGIRASSTCEILLEDCRVPKENILGEFGKGYKVAIETLNEGRIGIGAQMVGIAQGAFDAALGYIQERKQFGKAISEFQGVQFQLARMATDIETARLLVYNAARMKMAGQPFLKEAAMAKFYSSEVAERVASMAVDLYGGNGFVKEYPVEKFYRDAKIGKIYEGTTNMQLMTIAKLLLR